jgi:hypothetical protein
MLKPQNGGCWFCCDTCVNNDYEVKLFSQEFDTYVHLKCLQDKYKIGDIEAKIIWKEFK